MKRKALLISILLGMAAGQLVAEGERSWTLTNTLRIGYDDNVHRDAVNEDGSFFVTDIVDLGWRASLSDRTDFTLKTQLVALSDKDQRLYPNLYAVLNHSVTPRVLMSLSDYFRYADRTGQVTGAKPNKRYDYYYNRVMLNSSYVFNPKTRVQLSLANAIERNDNAIKVYDTTRNSVGISVARELKPQQTHLTIAADFADFEYENLKSDYQQATASAELGHTFNPEWNGVAGVGVDYLDKSYVGQSDDTSAHPRANLGLTYSPSPRTRISGSYSRQFSGATSDTRYIGSLDQTVKAGVQHDLTAKTMIEGTARDVDRDYDADDQQAAGVTTDNDEERLHLALRVHYKLNRTHYLEAGVSYTDVDRKTGGDWDQSKVDVGWRIEI